MIYPILTQCMIKTTQLFFQQYKPSIWINQMTQLVFSLWLHHIPTFRSLSPDLHPSSHVRFCSFRLQRLSSQGYSKSKCLLISLDYQMFHFTNSWLTADSDKMLSCKDLPFLINWKQWNSPRLYLFIAPTSKRSKPVRVITAALNEGLLIISPLSLLQPQILDVSVLRSQDGWFCATHCTLSTICSNAQKMCRAEWRGPLLQTRHPSGRKQAASTLRRGRAEEAPLGMIFSPRTWHSAWPAWIIRMRIIIIIMLIKCSK